MQQLDEVLELACAEDLEAGEGLVRGCEGALEVGEQLGLQQVERRVQPVVGLPPDEGQPLPGLELGLA